MTSETRPIAGTTRLNDRPDAFPCPSCNAPGMTPFYEVGQVPVHSCLLLRDLESAKSFPKDEIRLGFCRSCGFIANTRFDARALTYTEDYEETQGFSPRFNAFAGELAQHLVEKYDLRDKDILEIGCGKGEFLALLCELGDNRGTGIDPTNIPGRLGAEREARITFIRDFYSEQHAHLTADLICCRHTLEHIQPTLQFLTLLRSNIGDRSRPIVFFEVPDVSRILKELAFWDVYYEHCSYFSLGSLTRLFRSCGFEVLAVSRGFDDQYLLIEATPLSGSQPAAFDGEDDLEDLAQSVSYFQDHLAGKVSRWRSDLDETAGNGQRVVLWGSGSKAVAYLQCLGVKGEIEYVVDINPFKQNMYLAGSGHLIVAPEFLKTYRPDVVIAMNSTYLTEIGAMLDQLGVESKLTGL